MSQSVHWQDGCQQLAQLFEQERHHLLHSEVVQLQAIQQEKIRLLGHLQQLACALEPQTAVAEARRFKRDQRRNRQLLHMAAQLVGGRLTVRCRRDTAAGYSAQGTVAVAAGQRSLLAGWV